MTLPVVCARGPRRSALAAWKRQISKNLNLLWSYRLICCANSLAAWLTAFAVRSQSFQTFQWAEEKAKLDLEADFGYGSTGIRLELQVALDELAEAFAVFVAHVHEFNPVAILADVADHRCEIDLAQAGAHFQFDRIAYGEFFPRFQIGAPQADGFYAGEAGGRSFNLRA